VLSLITEAVQAIFHAALRPDREDQLIVMLDNALADFEAGVDVLEPGTMPQTVREIDRLRVKADRWRDEAQNSSQRRADNVQLALWLIAEARWEANEYRLMCREVRVEKSDQRRIGEWLIAEARWLQERHSIDPLTVINGTSVDSSVVATHWFLEHSATSQTATPAPSPHAGVATPTGAGDLGQGLNVSAPGPGGTPN
jgi:hypothetical protein